MDVDRAVITSYLQRLIAQRDDLIRKVHQCEGAIGLAKELMAHLEKQPSPTQSSETATQT